LEACGPRKERKIIQKSRKCSAHGSMQRLDSPLQVPLTGKGESGNQDGPEATQKRRCEKNAIIENEKKFRHAT